MAISFIANAVSGAVVSERAFHYNGFDKLNLGRTVLTISRCEAYNCDLLRIFSVRIHRFIIFLGIIYGK